METIFSKSRPGRRGVWPKPAQKEAKNYLPENLLRSQRPKLPEVSELDVVRHYTLLSRKNFG